MVYQNTDVDANIWGLRVPTAANRDPSGDAPVPVIESTYADVDPEFSPDGTRIVFVSLRSGSRQLWISNRDGSEPRLLTTFDGMAGSPSWSPDGKRIAFDGMQRAGLNLHIVSADGGPILPLTADAFDNIRPSWSSKGEWIYFGSERSGECQIWRMPSAGGKREQITRGGGMTPIVAPDGQHVYYMKQPPAQGIWEVPAEGGQEIQIAHQGGAFDVLHRGVFLVNRSTNPFTVELFSFATRQRVAVARLPSGPHFGGPPANFAVSRDGHSMLYVQYSRHSDIEMLPSIR